jgi:Ca2+-dependent lipid-binding protein
LKNNAAFPVWNETFVLYVKDMKTASIEFKVRDKNYFSADEDVGFGVTTVQDLLVSE